MRAKGQGETANKLVSPYKLLSKILPRFLYKQTSKDVWYVVCQLNDD